MEQALESEFNDYIAYNAYSDGGLDTSSAKSTIFDVTVNHTVAFDFNVLVGVHPEHQKLTSNFSKFNKSKAKTSMNKYMKSSGKILKFRWKTKR